MPSQDSTPSIQYHRWVIDFPDIHTTEEFGKVGVLLVRWVKAFLNTLRKIYSIDSRPDCSHKIYSAVIY